MRLVRQTARLHTFHHSSDTAQLIAIVPHKSERSLFHANSSKIERRKKDRRPKEKQRPLAHAQGLERRLNLLQLRRRKIPRLYEHFLQP